VEQRRWRFAGELPERSQLKLLDQLCFELFAALSDVARGSAGQAAARQ
jgi:hypothetical protein